MSKQCGPVVFSNQRLARWPMRCGMLAIVCSFVLILLGGSLLPQSPIGYAAVNALSNSGRNPEPGVKLTILDDANGQPIKDFRILAGTVSGISREFERKHNVEVANWQSHTIRSGANGKHFWSLARAWKRMALRIEADGYIPHSFYGIEKADGSIELTCRLEKDPGVTGTVKSVDGKSAATGAVVALGMVRRNVVLKGTTDPQMSVRNGGDTASLRDQWERPVIVNTDEDGRFTLPTEPDPTAAVVIVHNEGVLHMPFAEWKKSPHVTLQPWGLIHGRVLWGDRPGSNERVSLSVDHGDSYGYYEILRQHGEIETDANGKFIMHRVLPGRAQLSRSFEVKQKNGGTMWVNLRTHTTHVDVIGPHTSAMIGGKGVSVTGKLTGLDNFDGITFRCSPDAPHFNRNTEGFVAWMRLKTSQDGRLFFREGLKVAEDGTFEISRLLPGSYTLFFTKAGQKQYIAVGSFRIADRQDRNVPSFGYNIGAFKVRQPNR